MNKVHVAIIDDGVNEGFFSSVKNLANNIQITNRSKIISVNSSRKCELSHGTICAAIVKHYTPNIIMSSINILHNMRGTKEKLITAIEWCLKAKIDVVNLSLGTEDYRDYKSLRSLSNYAYSQGLIIVAACSNNNVITYPASLSNVIGVKCSQKEKLKEGQYIYRYYEKDKIDIMASSVQWLVDKYNTTVQIPITNSYAAPLVTALVSEIIYNFKIKNIEFIKQKLKEYSKEEDNQIYDYNPFFYTAIDWVDKAILFEIGEGDQTKYCDSLGIKDIFCVNGEEEIFPAIKQYLYRYNIKLNDIDTIIINVSKKYDRRIDAQQLIEYISKMGKNVVYLNDHYQKDYFNIKDVKVSTKIYYPMIQERWTVERFDESINLEIPIIVVYNYSNRNLCDVFQVLQNCFRNDGYHSITITQTCKGLLYNLKYISSDSLYAGGGVNKVLLKCLEKTYNVDLIIIETDEYGGKLWASMEPDITIDVFSNDIHFNGMKFSQNEIQKVYKHMLECFYLQ